MVSEHSEIFNKNYNSNFFPIVKLNYNVVVIMLRYIKQNTT